MGARNYSTIAANNLSVGGVSVAEGMARASVNNAMRATLADTASLLLDLGGEIATTGAAGSYAVSLPSAPITYSSNLFFLCKIHAAVPGPSTINVNGLGAVQFGKIVDGVPTEMEAGDAPTGHRAICIYTATPPSILMLNPQGGSIGSISGIDPAVTVWLTNPTSANLAAAMVDESGAGGPLVFANAPSVILSNCIALPVTTGISGMGAGVSTFLASPTSANLAAALSDETGTGPNVFASSPTLVTPNLGIPSSVVLTNATGLPASALVGIGSGVATFLTTPSSANLAAALVDETGSGANVFANGPTMTLTNATGLPVATGISGMGPGVSNFLATPTSANLALALSDETGTGANVFATSPSLVTPALGIPSSGVLTNATGLPVTTGISGMGPGVSTFLASPTSANLAAALSDETGTGPNVFASGPVLVAPALGTPVSATLTNATGLPVTTGISGLGPGVGTFLATPTSANLAAALTDETGTGANVFATSPSLVTPNLGTPSAIVLTNATGMPASAISGLGTGVSTFLTTPTSANLAAAITDETGSGAAVFATSPTLVAPALGTPASAVLTNATGLPVGTGVSGLGAGVAAFLATPSSANLATALTDEMGGGQVMFNSVLDADVNLTANSDLKVATQRATKAYTDAVAVGIRWAPLGSALRATTANVALSGEQTIDGGLTSASRVLVKNQTTPTQNGIYTTTAGAWTRTTDADAAAELVNLGVFVTAGTQNAGSSWVCTSTSPPALGTDPINFVQVGSTAVYTAGTGLSLTGNTFAVADPELLAIAGTVSAADKLPYYTGSGTATVADFTAAGRALVDDADVTAQRTTLGLGTAAAPQFATLDLGGVDATLARVGAGDLSIEGNIVYRSGGTDVAVADGGTGASSAAVARANLGLSPTDTLQFTAIELGHATDTTLARSAPGGDMTVEGNLVYRVGGTDVSIADGGTGASTVAAARTNLGIGTADSPTFLSPLVTTIELGAIDTTLARLSAGDVTIEGNRIYRAGGADVPLVDGGTGASDATTARANLGLGPTDSPVFLSPFVTSLELGSTDTTLARGALGGDMTIEGNLVYRAGGTDIPITDGGTGASSPAAARAALGVGAADIVQFTSIELGHASDTTIARAGPGVVSIEGGVIYRVGGTDVTVLDGGTGASDAATARTNLGIGTADSPTFLSPLVTTLEVGAIDTTLARASAGNLSVEGNIIYRAGGTDVAVADGGTGASTAPAALVNLGLGPAAAAQFTTLDLGAATDATLARAGIGDLSVEGNIVYRAGGTDVPVADGGTGASTAAAALVNLGIGAGSSPTFLSPLVTTLDLGGVTDTTLTRSAAGKLAVEGDVVATLNAANTFLQTQSVTKTLAGGQAIALALTNASSTTNTETVIDIAPNATGVGVRSAQVASISTAAGLCRLVLRTSNGAPPADAITISPDRTVQMNAYGAGVLTSGSTGVITTTAMASGNYVPVISNTVNVATTNAPDGYYIRIGNVVTVSGSVSVTTTAAAATTVGISLPVASNFASIADAGGYFGTGETVASTITSNAALDILTTTFVSADTALHRYSFQAMYRVI